jgi:pimeloyl-ACP methyl ester carboxylesterase
MASPSGRPRRQVDRHSRLLGDRAGHPEIFEAFVSRAATEQRHTLGTSRPERYNPDTWTDEFAFLSRPGQREIQAELLYDYRTNVASYPAWQAWLRAHQPPTLVVWGRNDPLFITAGAESFKRDLPEAEIHLLDAGHFALDERTDEIAGLILQFLGRQRRELASHRLSRKCGAVGTTIRCRPRADSCRSKRRKDFTIALYVIVYM